jgi:hypothetical protein
MTTKCGYCETELGKGMCLFLIHDIRCVGPSAFFIKRKDAESLLSTVLGLSEQLRDEDIIPMKVKLKPAIFGIASDKNPDHADSFVVHSSNEVFEYIWGGD